MMEEVNVLVRILFNRAKKLCEEKGHKITILETTRTKQDQYLMYCQGRTQAQCVKAGVPKYLIDIAFRNKNMSNLPKKVNSLHSIHFEGKAIDIKSDDNIEVAQIYKELGFIVKIKASGILHVEIDGQFQNKFKYKSCNHNVINVLKTALNNKYGCNMNLNGQWDEEFNTYLKQYNKSRDLTIDEYDLEDLVNYVNI